MGAFFLSRLLFPLNLYLDDSDDAEPLDWASYLNQHHPDDPCMDHQVLIGKEERFAVRIVSYRRLE